MKKEKSSPEQERFAEFVLKIISPTVEQFEFKLHKNEVKNYSTTIVWKKENQYVKINSTTYPPDGLYYNAILGDGDSDDFFEYDWNSVAIWALAQITDPKSKVGSYDFPFGESVEHSLENANRDLLLYGETFLKGDLTIFNEARKKINKKRQPYKIHKPNENGVYKTENEPTSVEKKKKYS
jgi:hypothetical protein